MTTLLIVIAAALAVLTFLLCSNSKGFMSLRIKHNGRTTFRKALRFAIAIAVGMFFVGAVASPALATGHGQQFVQQQYVAVPQAVVVPYVAQQQAACVVQQFNAYSQPVQAFAVQPQFSRSRSFQRSRGGFSSFNRSSFRQQSNFGGNSRSFSFQSQSNGRGGLRSLFPF